MNFPKGYAVVLTERGLDIVGNILGTGSIPKTPMEEPEEILKEVSQRVSNLLDQQLAIEQKIGSVDLQAIYNNYALQKPITFEELYDQIKAISDGLDISEENYANYAKGFDSIITKYHDIAKKVGEELGKILASGKTYSIESAVSELKIILKNLQNFQLDLDKIDKAILEAEKISKQSEKDILRLKRETNDIAAKYLESGTWNIIWKKDEKMPDGRRVHITQSVGNGKNQANKATKALQALANESIKRADGDAEKVRNKKYSTIGKNVGEFQKKLSQAQEAIAGQISTLSEEKKKKYAKSATTEMFNTLADAIAHGHKTATFTVDVGSDNASKMGDLMEIIHTFTMPTDGEMVKTGQSSITFTNTGEMMSRTVPVQVEHDTIVKYHKNEKWDFDKDEVRMSVKNYQNEDGTYNLGKRAGKTDNVAAILRDDGQQYYVAFNDKFYSAYNLQNIGLIGSTFVKDGEMDESTLLRNMDLFTTNDALSEQLIFALLNLSSASYLSTAGEDDFDIVKNIVKKMVSAYIMEIAWDVKAFVQSMETISGMNESNTLCVFNFSDALFVKASEVLRGIQKQLSDSSLIKEMVSVQVAADTIHQAMPLWRASLDAEPDDQKARWNWVATQVAANTKLSVKLNVQALLQIFAAPGK